MFILGDVEKESVLLVTFQYGDTPTYVRYTDWAEDVVHPLTGETFYSMVEMEVKLGKMTGILKEPITSLKLLPNTFTLGMSIAEPHPDVYISVDELTQDPDETIQKVMYLFNGRVRRTVRSKGGKSKTVYLECENVKARFDVALGLVAGNHCVWILGRKGCDPSGTSIAIDTLTETGLVDSIDGTEITITGVPAKAARYWHRGYILFNNLPLLIREWVSGDNFLLALPAPSVWDGQTVTLYPGCDKTIETCRAKWNNEEHFCGAGYAMPPYHPVFETP